MKNDNTYNVWQVFCMAAALGLWLALIAMKAAGMVDMHWALVLSGIVWISWGLIIFAVVGASIAYALYLLGRWYRCKRIERRIIRQCKAVGVWDVPQVLCGRALDLKMWKDYKIKREPDETDEELRTRWRTLFDDDKQEGAESDG